MRKVCFLTITTFLLSSGFINCSTKDSSDTLVGIDPGTRIIGTWSFASALFSDSSKLSLTISADQNFSILLNQKDTKTLFISNGTWEYVEDSLALTGNNCQFYDTTTSELAPLDEITCASPFSLPLPQTDTTWKIRTANFHLVLSALPISEEMIAMVLSNVQHLTLIKEESAM